MMDVSPIALPCLLCAVVLHGTGAVAEDVPMASQGGNLVFLERFNDGLSAWKVAAPGGTAKIVVQDFNNKLQLTATEGSASSATRTFAEPEERWILEYDEQIGADGNICIMELLGKDEQVIATVAHGTRPGELTFRADQGEPATAAWPAGKRKQVVVRVDRASRRISTWISEDNHTYGSLSPIGADQPYSGSPVSAVRFRTASAAARVQIDEVKVFTPNFFLIGDSISDGKPRWSTHPEYPERLAKNHDETSSPSYQLSQKFKNEWVANRGFGGSTLGGVASKIESVAIRQGAKGIILHAGHNDIYPGKATLASLQKQMDSLIEKLQRAGLQGRGIILCSVSPSAAIDTPAEQETREAYNAWLQARAREIGATFADVASAVRDQEDPGKLNRAYDVGDGVHFGASGSGVIAGTIFQAMSEARQ
jgi:lysophospholipase L1-like esterase